MNTAVKVLAQPCLLVHLAINGEPEPLLVLENHVSSSFSTRSHELIAKPHRGNVEKHSLGIKFKICGVLH